MLDIYLVGMAVAFIKVKDYTDVTISLGLTVYVIMALLTISRRCTSSSTAGLPGLPDAGDFQGALTHQNSLYWRIEILAVHPSAAG